MVDIRQTQEYANYLKTLGWTTYRKAGVNYFVKKIALSGILKIQRPETLDLETIREIAKLHKVFNIVVEPKTEIDARFLLQNRFKQSKSPFLPTKTLLIDLTKTKESLWKDLNKKTRYSIKKYTNKNTGRGESFEIKKFFSPPEIEDFRKAWKKNVKTKRYVPSAKQLKNLAKSFKKHKPLFLASHNKNAEIVAGAIFTQSSSKISYYWQAFSGKNGRSSLSGYTLLWHGILWAKSQGCKLMDLEGIYDPRFPNKSWQGFSHFKKSFGGEEREYPGAFVKYQLPF